MEKNYCELTSVCGCGLTDGAPNKKWKNYCELTLVCGYGLTDGALEQEMEKNYCELTLVCGYGLTDGALEQEMEKNYCELTSVCGYGLTDGALEQEMEKNYCELTSVCGYGLTDGAPQQEMEKLLYFHDPGILDRVPTLFLIMGAVQGGILLVGLLLYQEPPSEILEEREDYSVIPVENSSNHKVEETEQSFPRELEVTPKEALKMYEFYILLVMCIGSLHSSLFVNNFYKTYGQTFIDDDIFLATTGSVSSIVHVVLRVVMGLIQDKISFKLTSLILMGLKTVLLFTLIVTPYGGRVMFIMWICGLFATFPVEFVCIPAAIAEVFGNKHTAMIYGVIYFVVGTSVVVWPLIIQITFPYFGWFATFCLIGSISFIGFLASMVYPENFHRQPAKSTICNDEREQVLYGTVVWQK
ncbi:uncharacterized protein LOC143228423 [Tachypleus tridentatus]|uniref:uncharacterized protein LOC143228423 n=1 Tax=Tachypleus tridentatus TaxID=6853 RepID=UPI003FD16348